MTEQEQNKTTTDKGTTTPQEDVKTSSTTDNSSQENTSATDNEDGNTTENDSKTLPSPAKDAAIPTEATPEKSSHESSSSIEKTEKNVPISKETPTKDDAIDSTNDDDENDYDGDIPMKPYDEMNLDALTEDLERLLKKYQVKEIRTHVREIKKEFELKFGEKRDQQKTKFLEEGGNIIDFSYSTPTEKRFNKLYFDYKEKRDNYYKQVRKNLQENLERRLAIIEELKGMIGVGNDMNANFSLFKQLQERWRKAGPVPSVDYKDTWHTYHHHVERFYEFLHLDREFREMDYKHNLEQKLKMVARAEELTEEPDVNLAFRELQNLHRMWKEEVGPVAQEYSEDIWEKFSTATKKIHGIRKEHFAKLDKAREKNLDLKKSLIQKIQELAEKPIKSHRQAQNEIKIFKDLRDQFFKAGQVPKKENQETWDAFKSASRHFNHKKNEFYKTRKIEQQENLDKKLELIEIAEAHQDSDDFDTVTPLMKKIQSDWKKVGFVQRRKSDQVWKRFKKACNHYFNRLQQSQNEQDQEALQAFDQKVSLLEATKALPLSDNKEEDLSKIKAQIEQWKAIGRVPKNKHYIEGKFNKVLDKLFKKLELNKKEAEMIKYDNRLQSLEAEDDDYKIQKEANFLRKKIDQTTDEVRQLETNLQFFNNANKDNPLMKEAFKNIDRHKQQLKIWKAKLEKLRQL